MKIRWGITRVQGGLRVLALPNRNQYFSDSEEEAQQKLKDILENNNADTLRSVYGDTSKMAVRAVLCYASGEAMLTVFEDDLPPPSSRLGLSPALEELQQIRAAVVEKRTDDFNKFAFNGIAAELVATHAALDLANTLIDDFFKNPALSKALQADIPLLVRINDVQRMIRAITDGTRVPITT